MTHIVISDEFTVHSVMGGPGERALILLCRVDLSSALDSHQPGSNSSEKVLTARVLSASMAKFSSHFIISIPSKIGVLFSNGMVTLLLLFNLEAE